MTPIYGTDRGARKDEPDRIHIRRTAVAPCAERHSPHEAGAAAVHLRAARVLRRVLSAGRGPGHSGQRERGRRALVPLAGVRGSRSRAQRRGRRDRRRGVQLRPRRQSPLRGHVRRRDALDRRISQGGVDATGRRALPRVQHFGRPPPRDARLRLRLLRVQRPGHCNQGSGRQGRPRRLRGHRLPPRRRSAARLLRHRPRVDYLLARVRRVSVPRHRLHPGDRRGQGTRILGERATVSLHVRRGVPVGVPRGRAEAAFCVQARRAGDAARHRHPPAGPDNAPCAHYPGVRGGCARVRQDRAARVAGAGRRRVRPAGGEPRLDDGIRGDGGPGSAGTRCRIRTGAATVWSG